MRIGLGELNIFWEDKRKNMQVCEDMIKLAKEKEAELLVFPEIDVYKRQVNI